ncbi:LPP20 family lipoprotein [Sulfurimonas sp.]|uniref:LPP20 family lipoprotein n=1 Tax=Sulfurimonas sp. TaxID=2022749 RepID=UPI0025FF5DED|nr:LPP20 family lipoprotein [Sulfurimonas sp.]MCK9474219.1 LPP20 family lipoprotein [Sulfurimonas sp.]MDD3505192.1 LPP20 family lipoprotein [Sulfurimonas sp.]
MRNFFILFLVAASFLFFGCASKDVALVQKKELPSWYLNPPKTTQTTLYAVGEAKSRDAAIQDALSMMASTLSVSIASQFHSKEIVQEGAKNSYQTTISNEIQSDVKKIRISSYELIEAKEVGFRRYIVLVKSDKRKLFESLKNELDQKFALIDEKLLSLDMHHAIKQLNIYKKLQQEIGDVPNTLIVMNVLEASFDANKYIYKAAELQSKKEKLLSLITFSIEADNNSKNLQAPIRAALSAKKFQMKKNDGKYHFNISVSSDIQKASSYGFTLARSAIEILVKDHKNSIVGSNKINLIGQSTQGYEVAKQSLSIKLDTMIKKEGIGKVIGLEL